MLCCSSVEHKIQRYELLETPLSPLSTALDRTLQCAYHNIKFISLNKLCTRCAHLCAVLLGKEEDGKMLLLLFYIHQMSICLLIYSFIYLLNVDLCFFADLNFEPEEAAAGSGDSLVQHNATRREAQDMGRILQRLLREGVKSSLFVCGLFFVVKLIVCL